MKKKLLILLFISVSAFAGYAQIDHDKAHRRYWYYRTRLINDFMKIGKDILRIQNAEVLFEQAAERKPRMLLLPYGIPMTIAALGYFVYQGMYL